MGPTSRPEAIATQLIGCGILYGVVIPVKVAITLDEAACKYIPFYSPVRDLCLDTIIGIEEEFEYVTTTDINDWP